MERGEPADEHVVMLEVGEGSPCCTGCGRPYVKGMNYCDHCGTAVGRYTPYIPYVNIRHNYSPFVTLVKRALRPRGLRARKAIPLYLFLSVCALMAVLWVDGQVGRANAVGSAVARLVALAAVVILVIVHIVQSVRRGDVSVKAFFKTTMLYLFLMLFVFFPLSVGICGIITGHSVYPKDWLPITGVFIILIIPVLLFRAKYRKSKGKKDIPYGECEGDTIDNQSDRSEN